MPNELKIERYIPAFPTAVNQIEKLSRVGPVVAEGPGLLPVLLASHHVAPEKAIYLLPTPSFQRNTNQRRGEWVQRALASRADLEIAWEEWMQLDDQFANLIEESATQAHYTSVRNDGGSDPGDVFRLVEKHFGLVE
ncbi:MAG: hypothetical protein HQ478_03930 [Chloroflexi bacterium]|nr:hypothetical protein [Chloroflexota bacterium]